MSSSGYAPLDYEPAPPAPPRDRSCPACGAAARYEYDDGGTVECGRGHLWHWAAGRKVLGAYVWPDDSDSDSDDEGEECESEWLRELHAYDIIRD